VFEWDAEGVAYVKNAAAARAEPEAVRSAELACPSRAIRVAEHVVPPEGDS
jgi:ferredoxin